ncbi:MAG: heme oxygenase [Bacteroidetes bacterium 43-16]|nr:MAG: heme oxygenase [Bacteroidetes bacterium 43-16]
MSEILLTSKIEQLQAALMPFRRQLADHPLYSSIKEMENLKVFTQNHVYAVWDFMSLLKALQIRLTSVSLPWQPVGDAETRFLINEIVTGEESDVDESGNRCSHFELYLEAMQQLGVDTLPVLDFSAKLSAENYQQHIAASDLHEAVKAFLTHTFDIAFHAPTHVIASVFTFGREDIIPDMFIGIVRSLASEYPEKLSILKYYLERHIEVDGGEHSDLGMQMVSRLCAEDEQKWQEATDAAIQSLQMRIRLWDGIKAQL